MNWRQSFIMTYLEREIPQLGHYILGGSFEGFVIENILSTIKNKMNRIVGFIELPEGQR